jgi:hypothetical protein
MRRFAWFSALRSLASSKAIRVVLPFARCDEKFTARGPLLVLSRVATDRDEAEGVGDQPAVFV